MNCVSCPSNGWCVECCAGYGLDLDGVCAKCPDNCALCSADGSAKMRCVRCNSEYCLRRSGGGPAATTSCVKPSEISPHCASCGGGEGCAKCADGYCLESGDAISAARAGSSTVFESMLGQEPDARYAGRNACVPKEALSCTECRDGGQCTKCEEGFGLLPNGICARLERLMCAVYSEGSGCTECYPGSCLVTLPGHNYNVCEDRPGCEYCQDGECIQCRRGTCYAGARGCSALTCDNCEIRSGDGRCAKCIDRYCLDSHGVCLHVSALNCAECPDNRRCTKCPDGYAVDRDGGCSVPTEPSGRLSRQLRDSRVAAITVPVVLLVAGAVFVACYCVVLRAKRR
ncbi:Hypothetical protein GLP15_4528 [Giardia lamblia P15]|uniref:Uncharacterized protein n=1 Tax=Giardia intestinalis (strain P15) TaxID=658858 RepID=E1F3D6_GIAIA|nr:Hypothetical protein GLP15_4528 [Giardia lamblia P15]